MSQKISKWTRDDDKSLLQDPVYGLGMGKRVAELGDGEGEYGVLEVLGTREYSRE